jgi:methanogenic corrinoid protein MtbC1
LEAAGWDVDFLGAGARIEELVAAIARAKPELIALSVSIRSHVGALEQSVRAARRVQPSGLIAVGGQGLASDGAERVAEWGVPGVEFVPSLGALERRLSEGLWP